jgi:pyruvate formate lyase activating enzyme
MREIESDVTFYDQSGGGVTFSGGEPLLQHDFLRALLEACKARDIHTAVDTCGFAAWALFERIRRSVDLFLFDLKLMDAARHCEYTGVPNEPILRNLRQLAALGHRIVIRVPIIPGINDDDGTIGQIGAFAGSLSHIETLDLLPYHDIAMDKYQNLGQRYRLPATRPPSSERMSQIASRLRAYGLAVTIGGQA